MSVEMCEVWIRRQKQEEESLPVSLCLQIHTTVFITLLCRRERWSSACGHSVCELWHNMPSLWVCQSVVLLSGSGVRLLCYWQHKPLLDVYFFYGPKIWNAVPAAGERSLSLSLSMFSTHLLFPPQPVYHRFVSRNCWGDRGPPCTGRPPSGPGSGTAAVHCTRSPLCLETSGKNKTKRH